MIKLLEYIIYGMGILFVLSALFLVAVVVLIKSVDDYEKLDISTPEKATKVLNEFAEKAGVVFPEKTHLLNAAVEHGIDSGIYLKIQIKPKDLETFLKEPVIGKIDLYNSSQQQRYPGFLDNEESDWWKVSKVNNWEAGEISFPDGSYLDILIDYDHTDDYIIYLTWGFV